MLAFRVRSFRLPDLLLLPLKQGVLMHVLTRILPTALIAGYLVAGVALGAGGAPERPAEAKITRRAFRFRVHAEKLPAYREWHRKVYPELLRDMTGAGIRNYSLFLDGEGNVFGYLESADWARADAAMAKSDANRRWQVVMKEYIVQPTDPATSPATTLEEVFHLP